VQITFFLDAENVVLAADAVSDTATTLKIKPGLLK
jgi:hypothetical protein